jgi:hypothetical protein
MNANLCRSPIDLVISLALAVVAISCRNDARAPDGNAGPAAQSRAAKGDSAQRGNGPAKSAPAGSMPSFRMIGAESGLAFERYDDIRGLRRIIEANGGGAALFDFDGDGLLDVFLTNGCRLPRRLDDRRTPSQLFRNRGGMQFESAAGDSRLAQFGYATGCTVGDYNADGFDDLYVAAFGPNTLWRNNGDGTFGDVTAATGTAVSAWSSSAAFADVNNDGHLDLYVVNYLDDSDEAPRLCPNPASPDGYEQCSPAFYEGVDDVLFVSDGAGGFVDVTAAAGIAGRRGKGLGVVIGDLDHDGRQEIFVANDGQANFLFVPASVEAGAASALRLAGPRTEVRYREEALSRGLALNASGYAQANMGIAAGDYDGNGTLDLFITTFFGDTNTLFANRGGLSFEDVTRSTRLGATIRNKLGFGTVFFDPDNDGWLDLMIANGHVDDRTWMTRGEPYRMRPQLFRNQRNGSFIDVSAAGGEYFLKEWLGRGLAVGDLDRDGKLDAVVNHQLAPSLALHNRTPTENGAIVVRLVGTVANRNGSGAWVEVACSKQLLVRELVGGGSFQSASAQEVHAGIGADRQATVRIHWPSGRVDVHADLIAGYWVAIEGRGIRRPAL